MRLLRWLVRRPSRTREWSWNLHGPSVQPPSQAPPVLQTRTVATEASGVAAPPGPLPDHPGVKVVLGFDEGPEVALDDNDGLSLEFRRLADAIWKQTVSSSTG